MSLTKHNVYHCDNCGAEVEINPSHSGIIDDEQYKRDGWYTLARLTMLGYSCAEVRADYCCTECLNLGVAKLQDDSSLKGENMEKAVVAGDDLTLAITVYGVTTYEVHTVSHVDEKGIWLDNGPGNDPSGPYDSQTGKWALNDVIPMSRQKLILPHHLL